MNITLPEQVAVDNTGMWVVARVMTPFGGYMTQTYYQTVDSAFISSCTAAGVKVADRRTYEEGKEMPIKGLTDKGASFPRIGELRKGDVKTDPKRPGKDLDHFRFTSDDQEALNDFREAYGDTPRSIRCYLPFQTTDQNFQTFMEEWKAGGLVRRCDGENIVLEQTKKGYDKLPHQCLKAQGKPCGCKQVGRLSVMIPELRRFAYVIALTSSTWDIVELHANLLAIEEARGDLRGIPFVLSRKLREVSTPSGEDGKRVRTEKWLLSIEAAPAWVKGQMAQLSPFEEPAQLPAPGDDDAGPQWQPAQIEAPKGPTLEDLRDLRNEAQGAIDTKKPLNADAFKAVKENWELVFRVATERGVTAEAVKDPSRQSPWLIATVNAIDAILADAAQKATQAETAGK